MVVVNINGNYFRGVIIDDELTIISRVKKINAKNFIYYQQITCERTGRKEVISDALMKFVCIDVVLNKAVVIDGELLEKSELSKNDDSEFI
ncbi:acyl-CoA thioesterase FadM [Providencia alcalifaciens]|nr:acyl-CoA thioesterase FadM [Providencia alcalifaciens]